MQIWSNAHGEYAVLPGAFEDNILQNLGGKQSVLWGIGK